MERFTAVVHLCLFVFFSNGINGHVFDFASPIHYTDSCGPGGSWGLEGKVTLSSTDLDFFAPKIIFRASSTDLCSIDVYSCGQNVTSLANSTDVCQCVNKTGSVLSIEVKRALRGQDAGEMLQVLMPPLDPSNPITTVTNIGLIPAIYDANVSLTYQVGHSPRQPLQTSQVVSVCEGEASTLTVCAQDLPDGSYVSVMSGSREIRSHGPCVYETENFNFSTTSSYDIIVMLDDDRGCPVKEKFVLKVTEKDCRTTTTSTTTTSTTPSTTTPAPTSCSNVHSASRQAITLASGLDVLCATTTDGGGWLIFQRRANKDVSFNRNWSDYKKGFGSLNNNFWLGLDNVNAFCGSSSDKCELRIDVKYQGSSHYAQYSTFYVDDVTQEFRLHVSGYTGDMGDALAGQYVVGGKADGMKFSTPDNDNDVSDAGYTNCANHYESGWWFNNCMEANLNGEWGAHSSWEGLMWQPLTGSTSGINFSEMKFRRRA